jgi:hypothetical protein
VITGCFSKSYNQDRYPDDELLIAEREGDILDGFPGKWSGSVELEERR